MQKNWDFARACLARLAEAGLRVVVAGRAGVPGDPPYRGVDYLPQLPWPAFMRVMASARAAFLPNWWDASPCVLTQALALDVPVLVNRQILGGWKYVTPDTGAFFRDESDVVDAFFSLLDAPVRPRAWLAENEYGVGPAGRRLAAGLRALGGSCPRYGADLRHADQRTTAGPMTPPENRATCGSSPRQPAAPAGLVAGLGPYRVAGTAGRSRRQPRRVARLAGCARPRRGRLRPPRGRRESAQ